MVDIFVCFSSLPLEIINTIRNLSTSKFHASIVTEKPVKSYIYRIQLLNDVSTLLSKENVMEFLIQGTLLLTSC